MLVLLFFFFSHTIFHFFQRRNFFRGTLIFVSFRHARSASMERATQTNKRTVTASRKQKCYYSLISVDADVHRLNNLTSCETQ